MGYILALFLLGLMILLGLLAVQMLRIEKLVVRTAERVEEEVVSRIS